MAAACASALVLGGVQTFAGGLCNTPGDCFDGDVCQLWSCYRPSPQTAGLCQPAGFRDCDDGDPYTRDYCVSNLGGCVHYPPLFTPTPRMGTPTPVATHDGACTKYPRYPGTPGVSWCPGTCRPADDDGDCGPGIGPCPKLGDGNIRACCHQPDHYDECKQLACTDFFSLDLEIHPCLRADVDSPDDCALRGIPGCVECRTSAECQGATCEFGEADPTPVFGVCRFPTPTPTPRPPTRTPSPSPTRGPCYGDCNADGSVSVNELVLAVGMALGQGDVSGCPAADVNRDHSVGVNEIVAAVGAALNGCAAGSS